MKVKEKCEKILKLASDKHPTGLIPDWCDEQGNCLDSKYNRPCEYGYDASRIPWRIALDYLWNGNIAAKSICDKITQFSINQTNTNASNIIDIYNLDGSVKQAYKNNPIIGGMMVGSMCSENQFWLTQLCAQNLTRQDSWTYNRMTKVLTLFIVSGNFWKPE